MQTRLNDKKGKSNTKDKAGFYFKAEVKYSPKLNLLTLKRKAIIVANGND
jgi:hypothetical protein